MNSNESYVSSHTFGKVSAHFRRFADGDQNVIVNFGGNVTVYMPYSQAVALRAELDDALAQFVPEQGTAAA
ncbi:hypothetical protein ACIA8C_17160 [Nocardia sp. NPDC051321]|uniref:hypothetical protein n=1 Tax=Nocardia sp. NPDC051321 TaxID=3364323 RepID=UPI003793AC35